MIVSGDHYNDNKITFVINMVLFVIIKVMDGYQDDISPMNNPERVEQCDHCGRKLQDPADRLRWGKFSMQWLMVIIVNDKVTDRLKWVEMANG